MILEISLTTPWVAPCEDMRLCMLQGDYVISTPIFLQIYLLVSVAFGYGFNKIFYFYCCWHSYTSSGMKHSKNKNICHYHSAFHMRMSNCF